MCSRSYCQEAALAGETICETHKTLPVFRVGQKVVWYTRSRGVLRTKKGVVAFVVPAGVAFATIKETYPGKCYLKLSNGKPRDHESYGVLAQEINRPCPTLFWPRVQTLEKK